MKNILTILILLSGTVLSAQTILKIDGQTFNSPYTATHSTATSFTFSNNNLSTSNTSGYQLNAGDEIPGASNNNLDGSVITGNNIIFTAGAGYSTHGIFVGYQIDNIIKYNYSNGSPYGVVLKSGNAGTSMTDVSGMVAYNIFKNNFTGVLVKGFSGAKIYNNTFYNTLSAGNSTATIFIQTNESQGNAPSLGTKIKNNIMYQTSSVPMIQIRDASCTSGFESDYNVFYCAGGFPWFSIGSNVYTFAQWQALGYDTHSIVINPNFLNTTDFVPSVSLNYGTSLGATYQDGLSTDATWIVGSAPSVVSQTGTWQVGARIYGGGTSGLYYVRSFVEDASSSTLEMDYNTTLANIIPDVSAFSVKVNSATRTVNSVAITGSNVWLNLVSPIVYGDVVTVAYTKPATNPLQTVSGEPASTITAQAVTNNVHQVIPPVYVSSVIQNATPGILEMTYSLSLANIIPSSAAFNVTVNSVARTVNSVAISGTKVLLTLASPAVFGDVVSVSYTKPATNPIQTPAGDPASSISPQAVTNSVNAPTPVYVSSVIQNATPGVLEMTYSLSLANIIPSPVAFSVMVNSVARTVNSVAISGTKVQLTLASVVVYNDVVTVAYTKPAANPIQTPAGGQAASIGNQTVTNNINAPVPPVYVSSVIQNATPGILEMTYNLSLANIVPSPSVFSVLVNSVARTVNSVAISGTKVNLTLAAPVVFGDAVTVAYTKPATNPIQTAFGGQAASLTAQTVTNNVNAVISPVYVSSVVQNATPDILEVTYSLSLANIVPSSTAFNVMVNSVSRTVISVAVSGTKVFLTLTSMVAYGDVVTVAYTKPATNPIQTPAGGQAASIGAQPVTNNVSAPVSPVYVNSVIQDATPDVLEMNYNLSLAAIIPAPASFAVKVNSVSRTVNSVAVSGTKVLLTLATPAIYGDVIMVTYNKPATNPIQTLSGGQAATVTDQVVSNNVYDITIPVYVSSVIQNATPDILEMTYSLNLASIIPPPSAFNVLVNSMVRTVNSVVVSATKVRLTLSSPVVYGDVITVAYTKPATNPIQIASGGQAATLAAQAVTNNCTPSTNQPPSVSITSPGKNSLFNSPATITFVAVASDPDGTINKVEFFNGGTKIGESTVSPYLFVWRNVREGTYSLTAAATDNLNLTTVSTAVSVSVARSNLPENLPPVIKITNPVPGKHFVAPADINISVDVSDPDGSINKVEYYNGNTKIGESLAAPYSFSYKNATAGTYKITAIASDNLNDTASSSVKLYVSVYDENSELIDLYPNPNDGHFTIDILMPLKDERYILTIINSAGKTMYNEIWSKEENMKQFDFSLLNAGIYIIMFSSNEIVSTKKFIKN